MSGPKGIWKFFSACADIGDVVIDFVVGQLLIILVQVGLFVVFLWCLKQVWVGL